MSEQATLYERLGGADKVRDIVNDIIAAHQANPVVKVRFEHIEDLESVAEHVFEFFAAGTGGPYTYTGRDMRTTHTGMNVSEQEYLAVIDDIMAVLAKHHVGEREQQEVLAVCYGIKGEIIRV